MRGLALACIAMGCSKGGDDRCISAYHHLSGVFGGDSYGEDALSFGMGCHKLTDADFDCIDKMKDPGDARACEHVAQVMKESKRADRGSEAMVTLTHLVNLVNMYYDENASLPPSTPPTPAADCCAQGGMCPPDPAAWSAWDTLGFSIDEPTAFHYSIATDPARQTVTLRAEGDPGCTGTKQVFETTGQAGLGNGLQLPMPRQTEGLAAPDPDLGKALEGFANAVCQCNTTSCLVHVAESHHEVLERALAVDQKAIPEGLRQRAAECLDRITAAAAPARSRSR